MQCYDIQRSIHTGKLELVKFKIIQNCKFSDTSNQYCDKCNVNIYRMSVRTEFSRLRLWKVVIAMSCEL